MEAQLERPAEEMQRLRRCINDLVSVVALPAVWSGGEPSQIVRTLLDVLLDMLHLDLIYARLEDSAGRTPIEMARVAESRDPARGPKEIGKMLRESLGADPQKWPPFARQRFGDGDISIVPLRLGLQGELGVIIAGSRRMDFPGQTEKLLLSVAANQACIGLKEAWLLREQKRLAKELDDRVGQRTKELAVAVDELRLQVGLLQHLPVSTWTLKPDGTPDFVNQVWLEFAGQTLDFVRSHPEAWMAAVHPEDREMAARIFREGVRSGRGFAMETRSLRAQDGTYRWHLIQSVVLRDSEGKVLKFVGTTTDIDDQKRTGEALRRAQAELAHVTRVTTMGELAASIAHEVNQPLTAVVNNANACLGLLPDSAPQLLEVRNALAEIIDDADRASAVIARVRQLVSKTPSARTLINLDDPVADVLVLLHHETFAREVPIVTEFAAELPQVTGDRVQLQQVLLNLVVNGMDAMNTIEESERALIIRGYPEMREGRRVVTLAVQDAGIGFKRDEMDRLFEAFYTTKPHGMGMGLAISRSIIEAHGGRLWAEPNQSGGATFLFSLPAADNTTHE
jgi:PAS domain S-box-containing protein